MIIRFFYGSLVRFSIFRRLRCLRGSFMDERERQVSTTFDYYAVNVCIIHGIRTARLYTSWWALRALTDVKADPGYAFP